VIVHFLGSLEVGGKERVALWLARRAREQGLEPRLLLFDHDYRGEGVDLDPGDLPVDFLPRGPGLDLRFTMRVARYLKQHRAALLHAHNDSAIFYAALARKLMLRRRPGLVGTFHTLPGHDTPAARKLTRWATRRADHTLAVSDELGERLVRLGWTERYRTLWNGLDLDEYSPDGAPGGWRRELAIPEDALLVGHVGRFDPIKRHRDLLEAARRLAERGLPMTFVLVGEGPLRCEIEREVVGLAYVRLVPRVVDVAAFLRELDLYVICSEHEAAPMALLEAMGCGRAVVATAVGGIPDMLKLETADGTTLAGELVPPGRPQELAEALARLAGDAGRRRELGELARRRSADFSAEHAWAEHLEIYEAILPGARSGSPAP
jgi:glycosyltransferase involved in cell wall biosynthesis